MQNQKTYDEFLKSKIKVSENFGFSLDIEDINPNLKPHNKLMVKWLVEGGRRACFASFGLHKTVTQLETVRYTLEKASGSKGLIVCPLNIKQEFVQDSINILGWNEEPKFIRRANEMSGDGIYLTNYESIRDGRLDPRIFDVASLDEASVLRGFGGSKTFREFMRLFTGDAGPMQMRRGSDHIKYRFVATATPSPNDYIELLAYADFLGIMDISQAKTRFFKRDSTHADKLTLHAHKEEEFWLWVSSWALFVNKPSDITGDPADDASYTAEGCIVKNCPLQFDIADRVIEQCSNPGDIVLDFFSGLGTVPYRAILKGRIGWGIELSNPYFIDSAAYCKGAERNIKMPSLFDTLEAI